MRLYTIGLITVASLGIYLLKRMFRRGVIICRCVSSRQKHIVLTGATSGIGLAAAQEFCARNHKLTLPCRLKKMFPDATIEVCYLDLENRKSIKEFVSTLPDKSVDVLVNNAGVMPTSPKHSSDLPEDIDRTMLINYLGTYYLTNLMLPKLRVIDDIEKPRVVFVSSSLAAKGELNLDNPLMYEKSKKWLPMQSYSRSKLALNILAKHMHNNHFCDINVYTVVTGGMVNTNLNRDFLTNFTRVTSFLIKTISKVIFLTPLQGSQSLIHCAVSEDVPYSHSSFQEGLNKFGSGLLYRNCQPVKWPSATESDVLNKKLISETQKILKVE